jgi:dienelactone hydrolase
MTKPFDLDSLVPVLAAEMPREFAFRASDAEGLRAWQNKFRPRLRATLGLGRIAERGICPLNPRKIGEVDCGSYIREELSIQSEPGFELPFYLLRPKQIAGPLPLVLTPHGHVVQARLNFGRDTYAGIAHGVDGEKRIQEGERDIGVQAVTAGYVAIVPDLRGFSGLRRASERNDKHDNSCRTLQLHNQLFGRCAVGDRVWDIGRLIDYAATRAEVDTSRIVITGNSGGGTVSLFAAAVDERIGIAIPSCFFCTFEHSIGSIWHCDCNYVPGIMTMGEMYDVAGLIAPRPFLAVAGKTDNIFPIESVKHAYQQLLRIYQVAGCADRCRLSIGDGGHRYYKRDVWPFVAEFIVSGASPLRP